MKQTSTNVWQVQNLVKVFSVFNLYMTISHAHETLLVGESYLLTTKETVTIQTPPNPILNLLGMNN